MAKKLYVKNLAYSVTEDDLYQHFGTIGQVKYAKILRERDTNRSRGSGFIEMSSDDECSRAIMELSGKPLLGRNIFVEEARDRPMAPRQPRPQQQAYRPAYQEYDQPDMTMHTEWAQQYDQQDTRRKTRFQDRRKYNSRYGDA